MEVTHIQLWEKCLSIIKDNLSPEQFKSWFEPIRSLGYADGKLSLEVPSSYFVEHIEEHYLRLLAPVLKRVYGPDVQLFYKYDQKIGRAHV